MLASRKVHGSPKCIAATVEGAAKAAGVRLTIGEVEGTGMSEPVAAPRECRWSKES